MAKYAFTPQQRYAVFTAHGEACYLCRRPVDLVTTEVDHVIPESLLTTPDRLRDVLAALGRPQNFDINSYENWMPSCRPCNGKKSDVVFEPSPVVQVVLQQAAERAPRARELEKQLVTKRKLGRAINELQRYAAEQQLDESMKTQLSALLEEGDVLRVPEKRGMELRVAPFITVLRTDGQTTLVPGPYGVGGGPTQPSDAMRCPSCGLPWFNGARCVSCGALDDD